MNDDDSKNETTRAGVPALMVAFDRAITGIATSCQRLAADIYNHDFEGVKSTAREAVTMFFTAHAVLRRLSSGRGVDSATFESAISLIEAHRTAILQLFEIAKVEIAVPRTQSVLDGLRASVTTAVTPRLFNEIAPT